MRNAARISVAVAVAALAAALLLVPASAHATAGDVYAQGTPYLATTYAGHGNVFGGKECWTADLNVNGGDAGFPLYAPEDGVVTIYSTGYGSGYGNSVMWTSEDGRERIHLAHLSEIVKSGKVAAGDLIARVGHTGEASGDHLHISRAYDGRVAPIVLSGREIMPAWTGNGNQYYSAGPYAVPANVVYPGHPQFTKFGNPTYWKNSGVGVRGSGIYTVSNGTMRSSYARWTFDLAALSGAGFYRVEAFIPATRATTRSAHYHVSAAAGVHGVVVDQAADRGTWVTLGVFSLAPGSAWVELDDVTGEPFEAAEVAFDAVRLTRASDPGSLPDDPSPPEATRAPPASGAGGVIEDGAAGVTFDRFVPGMGVAYSGGTYVYGRWAGTALEVRFTGTRISWIGPIQPSYGMADLYIDGEKVARVDAYASPEEATLTATLWTSAELSEGAHTLRISLAGERNAASTGNVVVIDRFDVDGQTTWGTRLNETTKSAILAGSWVRCANPTYVAGTYQYSRWCGANYRGWFTGTRVAWIGPKANTYGRARIYIDGAYLAMADCYTPTTATGWRCRIWESGALKPGTHTIEIKPTGTRNPASLNAVVVVDALDVTP